jgi:hypothetical protein
VCSSLLRIYFLYSKDFILSRDSQELLDSFSLSLLIRLSSYSINFLSDFLCLDLLIIVLMILQTVLCSLSGKVMFSSFSSSLSCLLEIYTVKSI